MEQFETEFNDLLDGGVPINTATHTAILRFTTFFSFFEAKLCNFDGKQADSESYAAQFLRSGFKDVECLNNVYDHCRKRYFGSEEADRQFLSLCGCESWRTRPATTDKRRTGMHGILELSVPSPEQKLTFCLFFCFRLRNNLFHGPKWNNNMNKQCDNLHHASNLIYSILIETKGSLWRFDE